MDFAIRYCIKCRTRCGCVKGGQSKRYCSSCDKAETCYVKQNFSRYSDSFDTGTVCPNCFNQYMEGIKDGLAK